MAASLADDRPGLDVRRLARLVDEAVARCELDLTGRRVLTEAATGPYAVTPVIAARAGAEVVALTRDSRFGSLADVIEQTERLAGHLGVLDRITIEKDRIPEQFAAADVVTNSGHLRPIVGEHAAAIRPGAALSLMFEAWEIQVGRLDLDLDDLLARGVRIAGTNERHPHVDVFSFLGPMAVAQLADAGVSAYLGEIAVLCDNAFHDYLCAGLRAVGAHVRSAPTLDELIDGPRPDALVVAVRPTGAGVLCDADLTNLSSRWPDLVITQFWGDVDRAACEQVGLSCWPLSAPGAGHMGVLPSRVGPEPVVRLQAGGLKVAQVLGIDPEHRTDADRAYLDPL